MAMDMGTERRTSASMGTMGQLEERIYGQEANIGFFGMLRAIVLGFKDGRYLGKRLFIRDINALYRQSLLGWAWAIIIPALSTAVWVFLNKSGIMNIEVPGVPYPIFVLSGMVLWQSFLEALNAPLMSFNGSLRVLTKINFPKEALIISGIYKVMFNLGIKLCLLLLLFLYYGYNPGWGILLAPLAIIALILLGFSIGIIILPIGALYNDVNRVIQAGSQFVFLLTPILYPIAMEGSRYYIDRANPLAVMLTYARDLLLGLDTADLSSWYTLHAVVFGFLLLIGLIIYRLSVPILVERMGS